MSQVTRYHCPIGSCCWAHDAPGPDPASGTGTTVDEIVFSTVAGHLAGIEAIVREHLETHSLEEWAREVMRLRGLVPAPVPDLTAYRWRLGGSHKRSVYAEAGFSDGKPGTYAGHMDTDELAREAVEAHNAALDLSWLLTAGLDVLVRPCGGAGRCCGDTAGRFSVRASKPDPAADLSVPGGIESHGHASPGEALAFARDWCQREGIADGGLPALLLVRPGNGQLERLRAANARRPVEAAVL